MREGKSADEYLMTIDGELCNGEGSFSVRNPATEEVLAEAPQASSDLVDRAVRAASAAQLRWRVDGRARQKALRAFHQELQGAAEELAILLTREQGKPLKEARAEVDRAAEWLDYYTELDLPEPVLDVTRPRHDGRSRSTVTRQPLGVVAAITPWNGPLALAMWKIAPALRAGNTVVLKPSPHTPLTSLRLGAIASGVLPAGVLNVVSGEEPVGASLVEHDGVAKVSFTGSTQNGRAVGQAAIAGLKRLTMELGGNDPAIVLQGADVERVARDLFWSAFRNCGQVCVAVKRVYVHEDQSEELLEALGQLARECVVGDGLIEGTQLGPLNNKMQLDRVRNLVSGALATGGRIIAPTSDHWDRGYFHRPTILAGLRSGDALVDEEQFGPALPVLTYKTVDDAIAEANDSPYGLAASVWSDDHEAAGHVMDGLEYGQVSLNEHASGIAKNLPFGGVRESSFGVENGPWGLEEYTHLRVTTVPSG